MKPKNRMIFYNRNNLSDSKFRQDPKDAFYKDNLRKKHTIKALIIAEHKLFVLYKLISKLVGIPYFEHECLYLAGYCFVNRESLMDLNIMGLNSLRSQFQKDELAELENGMVSFDQLLESIRVWIDIKKQLYNDILHDDAFKDLPFHKIQKQIKSELKFIEKLKFVLKTNKINVFAI